jgi:hypothetical protein
MQRMVQKHSRLFRRADEIGFGYRRLQAETRELRAEAVRNKEHIVESNSLIQDLNRRLAQRSGVPIGRPAAFLDPAARAPTPTGPVPEPPAALGRAVESSATNGTGFPSATPKPTKAGGWTCSSAICGGKTTNPGSAPFCLNKQCQLPFGSWGISTIKRPGTPRPMRRSDAEPASSDAASDGSEASPHPNKGHSSVTSPALAHRVFERARARAPAQTVKKPVGARSMARPTKPFKPPRLAPSPASSPSSSSTASLEYKTAGTFGRERVWHASSYTEQHGGRLLQVRAHVRLVRRRRAAAASAGPAAHTHAL